MAKARSKSFASILATHIVQLKKRIEYGAWVTCLTCLRCYYCTKQEEMNFLQILIELKRSLSNLSHLRCGRYCRPTWSALEA
jgi:hypothetical protein